MQILNTTERWGAVSKAFHWIIVLLVLAQFTLGRIAHGLPEFSPDRFNVLKYHKSIGLTILALVILRLVWRVLNPAVPLLPDTLKPYERVIAKLTHAALYVLLFAMPVTGWLLTSASNFPARWFGLFRVPDLIRPDKELAGRLEDIHETLAWTLAAVAVLHIAGALKHHFWLKDNVLIRMTPFMDSQAPDQSPRR
jgi:cytochrome b561